ncbi:MAG: hypothetical protein JWP02_1732, partial [Acidimicrobiales bacterium]|nr:hypothetical protein [Acidimicrobiales bacterium]
FACTVVAGVLLLITYASARSGAALGAQTGLQPMAFPGGGVPGAVPGTQPVLMYVPVSQVPGALQPVGAPTGGNGSSLGVDQGAFAPAPPFLGYDEMTAEQVVKLVASGALTIEQLEALRRYEADGEARKTVLDKLDRALR